MSETTNKPQGIASHVRDALRNNKKVKVGDLTEAQRVRAMAAPDERPTLKGKALAEWIMEAEDVSATIQEEKAAASKPARKKAEPKPSKYSDEVRAAVKISNGLRGSSHGAGPKQHAHIREVVEAEVGSPVTVEKIVQASGFGSRAALDSVAAGEGDRTATKPLRPLAEKMGDDPWCKGRHLAAALAAWAQQLQG